MCSHPLFRPWQGMVRRCHSEAHISYEYYGGRGIAVYEPWRNDPRAFIEWAEENLGPRPDGHTLDREDPNGGYEPGNLRWM